MYITRAQLGTLCHHIEVYVMTMTVSMSLVQVCFAKRTNVKQTRTKAIDFCVEKNAFFDFRSLSF